METKSTEVAESAASGIRQYNGAETSTTALVLSAENFESMMRVAEVMSTGKSTIPVHLRNNPGDCMAVIMQSMQWGMNPFAVAQKTHLVSGTLGYEAQLVTAVLNTRAPITGRLQYEWFGPWDRVIGKFEIKRGDKGEYRVPGWKLADEEGCGVRVWATIKGEDAPRVLELLLAQARTRNSTLWADDPKQQLAYLASKRWSRLYCPDVILGVYTPEELEEIPREKNITPRKAGEYAERAQAVEELTPEAVGLIARLEAIANTGNVDALTREFGAIGKEGRKSVGAAEWERLKAVAADCAPIEGEAEEVAQ